MAEQKELSPIEALDAEHIKAAAERRATIDAAMAEVRKAQKVLDQKKAEVARLQQENINASFAHDAKRAELVAEARAKKAAA